jgi:hypothetical protein
MQLWELYKEKVLGTIKGLDRIRFRGTLRWLSSPRGINTFVYRSGILLKEFKRLAEQETDQVRSSCEQQAQLLGIPLGYLNSSSVDKEKVARHIAQDQGVAKRRLHLHAERVAAQNLWAVARSARSIDI